MFSIFCYVTVKMASKDKSAAMDTDAQEKPGIAFGVAGRGATEQSTLAERGKFHENSIPILRVDYSCAYSNVLKRLRFLGNKK